MDAWVGSGVDGDMRWEDYVLVVKCIQRIEETFRYDEAKAVGLKTWQRQPFFRFLPFACSHTLSNRVRYLPNMTTNVGKTVHTLAQA